MAIRLAICVITALLGLGLGALAPVSAADRPRLPATARRAARHLPVSAEEGAVAAAGRGLPGRPPDLFALGLRGQVVLAAAVAGRNALLRAASAQGPLAVPGARSARTAAGAAGGPAGPAARPARPTAALTGLGAARAAAASALAGAALDFDWRAYLAYYPELRAAGVATEGLARDHYARQGRAEGRLCKRVRLLLRYTAGTGLINQHYSHIAAIALAVVLGAELVLPPGVKRDSFAHYFSPLKERNEVTWAPTPLEALLDVDQLVATWRRRGLTIHRTPVLQPFPDLTDAATAFPQYTLPGINPRRGTRLENIYMQDLEMAELVERVRGAAVAHAARLLRAEPGAAVDYLVVDLPCTFFMLRASSNLPLVRDVARTLMFAPDVRALADRVVAGISGGGGGGGGAGAPRAYNSVHLRLEKDARDWSIIMGGQAVVWRNYIQAMRQAGFGPGVGVYVASGLLTYGANEEMADVIKTLTEAGLCSEVYHKELYLRAAALSALSSEQKALVDFLVLARGAHFVGFGSSTFSFFLREFRALAGTPRSASLLANASAVGTDPIFASAGTVA